ncbi:hypothetical protein METBISCDRAFT_21066 [Metschnikowia bicuspidata]|uniref:Translocation protein SEC66 n=1 Tax=Metschnikowia bicuspidata TaxID=27322 RepID=A0A4V1J3P7_9ASCO|nr:hypothetical protein METBISCDRAFT_21066 [Metschnikowia bicuspidata]
MAEEEKIEQVVKITIFTPLIYVAVMVTAFVVFSVQYKRHRLRKLVQMESLFGHNYTVDLYLALKDKYYNKSLPKQERPPEKAVKAALMRRAVEAIRRTLKLKENNSVFDKLYQDGLIGDDIFKQFELQNKMQQLELNEIVTECQQFSKEWPEKFFPVVREICFNEALRRRLSSFDARSEKLVEMWGYYVDKTESDKPQKEEKVKAAKEIKAQ